MSKIVILTRSYLDNTSANAKCAGNIMRELLNQGHEARMICLEKNVFDKHDENIYPVYGYRHYNIGSIGNAIKKIGLLLGDARAVFNSKIVDVYYKKLIQLHNISPIDVVVSVYFPVEGLQAIKLFKDNFPSVKAVSYEVDSSDDGIKQSRFNRIYDRVHTKWLKSVYSSIDSVIVMKSHVSHWNRIFGESFSGKMLVSDLPVLLPHKKTEQATEDVSHPYLIYSGLIEKKFRSPTYLLSVLKELQKSISFRFDFFSRGDCEDEISAAAKETAGICQRGFVPAAELDKALNNADCLVNIGNSVSRSLPSKLIQYISFGKPIIHFSSQGGDVCKEYLEKYPLALIIDSGMESGLACDLIVDFIHKNKDKKLSFFEINKVFPMNEPSFSANLIESRLE